MAGVVPRPVVAADLDVFFVPQEDAEANRRAGGTARSRAGFPALE
jgi:hypothetical protein